jgi:hypothetical protein
MHRTISPPLCSRPLLFLLLLCSSCGVQRTMTIESNPTGALVYLNGQEVGRTPLERDFTWYGNYDVRVEHAGYQTTRTHTEVTAPWWQWVPIDLLAELMPFRPVDRRHLSYTLLPASTQPADARSMLNEAREWQTKLASGENAPVPAAPPTTTTAPASQSTPSSQPTTASQPATATSLPR